MLTIRDGDGVDLTAVPPESVTVDLTTPAGTPWSLMLAAVENDTGLGARYVGGKIDWLDGNHVDNFDYLSSANGTLPMVATQFLPTGRHTISVYAHNYRAPVADEVTVNYTVVVVAPTQDPNNLRYLYGPILPKDAGFPNPTQWNFNSDKDLAVLASSVKMLLSTEIGERIMLPNYGTDIRALLFEPDIQGIETLLQDKITQALVIWEPRVVISFLNIVRNQNRSVTVNLTLTSRLTQQPFTVSTTIQQ